MKRKRHLKPSRKATRNEELHRWDIPAKEYQPFTSHVSRARKAIRKISKKGRVKSLIYSERRKWFLAQPENQACPVALSGLIPAPFSWQKVPHHAQTTEVHHAWKRGRYYLAEETWLAVCHLGHRWIEDNKAEARVRGWLCDTEETRQRWREKKGVQIL